jgi:ABC-type antimicrobial peptide transport system permease subunit
VLLIAAVNVASLLLARGVQRGREVAIRSALGGTRVQVMRPAIMETVVLTGFGLGLGILLAWLGVRSIGDMAAQRLPQLAGLAVNLRIVGFAIVLACWWRSWPACSRPGAAPRPIRSTRSEADAAAAPLPRSTVCSGRWS